MKKIYLLLIALSFLLISPNNLKANDLAENLKGRILLQVEEHGEAWYVNTDTKKRHFLGRPADAFSIMRELGLGITESDYYSFNNYAPQRLSGKILLRVQASGEAYYVNPVDLKMHYLGRPADAFNVMRTLGLGISNENLMRIGKVDDKKGSSIVSLDNTWNLYTNYDLGFKIEYPKKATNPIKITKNENVIYIHHKNAQDIYENWNEASQKRIKGLTWAILIEEVGNEYELNNLIKSIYGEACYFNNTHKKINNAYALDIEGDNCFAHMSNPVVRYDPDLNKVAIWEVGQDPSFWENKESYDFEMVESFQFIE